MATTGSVSKGHFVFKGKKKAAQAAQYFCDDKTSSLHLSRYDLYDNQWEKINQTIQILQSDLNCQIFEDLLEFVHKSSARFSPDRDARKNSTKEVPTAALITGVNMPDHGLMFSNLTSELRERVTPHIAVLRSKDCTNVKTVIDKIITQFIQNTDVLDDELDEADDHLNLKRVSCTMPVLASWYTHLTANKEKSSPKKQKSKEKYSQYPPLVVIMEDLEGFPSNVLQDFISICSNYLCQLPLVLVFGIATAVTAVHRLLPHQVSSLLCIEKFQSPPPTEYLNQVIHKIIMTTDLPFKLGSKVFGLLLDLFLFHDFSVLNFTRGVQFALMDHYLSHPYSILCVPLDDVVDVLKSLSHHDLDLVRRLHSFRRYVENRPPQEQISLLTDTKATKRFFLQSLENLHSFHDSLFPVLSCLHTAVSPLPGYPLGKQIRQLYSDCLDSVISETDAYKDAIALLRSLSKDELVLCISRCVQILSSDSLSEDLQSVKEKLLEIAAKFENIEDLAFEQEINEENEANGSTAAIPEKTDMYTLRKKLQEMQKQKKKLTGYELLRNETIDYLDNVFRKYLICPKTLPLHEVLYYDNVSRIKKHINGCPRASIQTALSNPYYYLQHEGCRSESGSISATLPDISIVFLLHLECGRLINLYDWLQAFVTVVTSTEDDDSGEEKKPDKLLQARFIRAVSELQFLGFIKPTKRKTDHVARLTW